MPAPSSSCRAPCASKSNVEFKVLLRDGDALITRARANLMTQFLDDPTDDTFPVRGCGYRLSARSGVPADRIRRRRGGRRLSDQARQLGQGEARDRDQPAERGVGLARLCAGDQRSRSCRRRQRLHARALCRNGIPDDPASRVREDVRRLCIVAVLPRAFGRCAGRKPQSICAVRMHDRSGQQEPISARILRFASAGPISAAKSGPTSRAGSTMSAPRYSTAISPSQFAAPALATDAA